MAERDGTARDGDSDGDVMRRLRIRTADEHEHLERTLDLLSPQLGRGRLGEILGRMHGFWLAAEAGLDAWAARSPADADDVAWPRRRRAALFGEDLTRLGRTATGEVPELAAVADTDQALGRLYVLEGSTLGGTFIDRHLAGLPHLSDVGIRAFAPYGSETGAMWAAFRRATRARAARGGDTDVMLISARATFQALAAWCGAVAPAPASRPT
ncbi:biliverdin-producing heme oxygenase [Blastococcus deserti]|uniref:Biliverdin-producing heme oxygenase n=1 Tax=Blastococcus deserti TaxID=2259033 RepID=A0ABW4XH26_9ACTN